MDNGFIASLQQQLQQANDEIQRLRASQGPSMPIPPPYPPQHLRPPLRPQFNASVPLSTVNQQYNNVRPSMPQGPPPIPHGPPPMPRGPPPMPQGTPAFTFGPFNNISQQIPILGHIPTAAKSKLFVLLTKLPGAAVPVEVEPKTVFQASPFVDELSLVDVPKKYTILAFATEYSGITDPVEHIAQYKQLMWTVPIPAQYQEVCMCKSFGSTLTDAALQWLINLKPKSIGSFAELVNQFTRQFASSRKMEKQTSDLYYIVQKSRETIRDYFNRFNAAMIEIKNCDVKTAIEAYKRGLEDSSGLYLELTKYPPENFDDVRARTLAFMRIEDDALFRRKHSAEKKPLGAQKHDFKHKRVNKIGNPRYESKARPSKGTVKIRYPELSTYNFAGTSKELVDSLRKIDANVRWPKKSDKPSKDKDQNRWCDFHEDHGHTTDECISLKKEISYLKSKGHLKGIIPEEQGRPASPVHTKVVNCITGGSEVCGLTYSAAKRHARNGPDERPIPEEVKSKIEKELDAMTITFDKDDTQGVHHKHHDALVIHHGNRTIRDRTTKYYSDWIQWRPDEHSWRNHLPVFAKGINKQTKFNVVDCQSAYNVILGRPWIYEMKAVPSTYHQKIKFPSPWGIQEIASENKEHSDCFAWSHEDMVGIDPNIISHKQNVDPTFKPIKQKRCKFAPERNKVINDEVDNLLKTGKIREVKYPEWLANVVVVQKKNGKWRVCIDFTDLNKACPKDPFPLPHIDAMVDATTGHELLTFMDAYSGYNQILMHTDDQEKTAFMTDKGIYCYKVMPFGLKNAGSTYQRLVNMMFKEHLGRTMEVYIDDMLVKSERSIDHVAHLKQSFDILRQYKMKLNPTKCSFGVRAGKFLGYLVTQRGIEASPEQVKAITEIQSPRGLDIPLRLGAKQLHVRSDSLLVVNQVNGDFQAKDSKMMSYLKAVKDRIARFEQFLIEQIPRNLNMQADALANLGSAFHDPFMENIPILHLTTPTIMAKDEVQMNVETYNWSLDVWNYLKHDQLPEDKMEARKTRSKASRYTIFEDQLYRRSTTGLLLRCVTSKSQINQILQEMHDGECGNHTGGRSLANRISRQGYYWPTLQEDAITYVQRCDACQKHSGMIHRPSKPLHSVLVPWPFMRWGMYMVGKLPPAPGQKVYLLVLTDYFSKWIEAGAFSQVRDK
ncbi:hypothetical protein OSB04_un000251 [Centaurea solstitialis]|uniref:Reverse transcriptase domain-containing protein n=1 Tax=Centaurea solstitialis TaxID=347529 RepID=A0AA38VVP2_9ASTR|nr:hypothetical protein OSB04_un000251 [Centaurea solstitialis]